MAAFANVLTQSNSRTQHGSLFQPSAVNPLSMAATSNANGAASSSNSATITSSDFLTLLVTEMQNQDPTATTDPNEYINQLVEVNSLQQLIEMNQNLATVLGTATAGTTTGHTVPGLPSSLAANSALGAVNTQPNAQSANPAPGIPSAHNSAGAASQAPISASASANPSNAAIAQAIEQMLRSRGIQQAPGNLGIPQVNPAARSVANALSGHSAASTATTAPRSKPASAVQPD